MPCLPRAPLRLALLPLSCLLSLFLARSVSAVPSATGHLIADALAELPDGLGREIQAVMTSMNMTERDTHFSRLVAYDVAEVNQSLALVTFPTPENGFEMSYVGMTHDLDPDGTYVAVVCGHTRPSACAGGTPHVAAPGDHPCGVDDAADPATGPFCEALALSHPSTEHGELLVHASEVLDSVAAAWAADARNYENPTLHLEIVDAETFADLMDVDDAGDVVEIDALEKALEYALKNAPAPAPAEGDASSPAPDVQRDEPGRNGSARCSASAAASAAFAARACAPASAA